jgi:hypothetical protein
VRVHPSPAYRELFGLIELKEDREIYAIANLRAMPELQAECFIATLFTAITRTGVLFLWPVRVPATGGRSNEWHTSMATAAQLAMPKWIRIKADMNLRAYQIFAAESSIPDPIWPELDFAALCRIALKDRLITSVDHPVSTYRLAMLLLYENWRLGGRPIVLSNVSALSEGLPARTKWRALGELERLGMVAVRRHPRRAPRIFLRHTKREPS